MDRIDNIVEILDYTIDTSRKRHIVGGILLSAALLFGGLAFTVMTTKMEDESYETNN